MLLAPLPRRTPVSRFARSAETFHERVAKRSHSSARTIRLILPFQSISRRFAAGLAAVLATESTRKSPPGRPEGLLRGGIAAYFAAMSSLTRWKNRARPVIRRTIFTACVSGSLNAALSSAAIASLSLPDRNR
jgi:hypothetical protein